MFKLKNLFNKQTKIKLKLNMVKNNPFIKKMIPLIPLCLNFFKQLKLIADLISWPHSIKRIFYINANKQVTYFKLVMDQNTH